MRQLLIISLLIILLNACTSSEKQSIVKLQTTNENSSNNLGWPPEVYNKIKGIEHLFIKNNVKNFDCADIEKYYYDNGTKVNTEGLTQVNDTLNKRLFGNYSNDKGTFDRCYLFSIEKPINNFYPITVIQYFGVVERPIIMILYDNKGRIVNSIEVADFYGETGGCLKSKFINDTILIQNIRWDDYGLDTLTNQQIFESTFKEQEVTIKSNGEIIFKELKKWTEVRKE